MNANPDVSERRGFLGGSEWSDLLREVLRAAGGDA